MKTFLLAAAVWLVGTGVLCAQVSAYYRPAQRADTSKNPAMPGLATAQIKAPVRAEVLAATARVRLSGVDMGKIAEQEAKEAGKNLPPRFGALIPVNLGLEAGTWQKTDSGDVWRLVVETEKALSVNLWFDEFRLAEGASLWIHNTEQTMVVGPVTAQNNGPDGKFGTGVIPGDGAILELHEPSGTRERSRLRLSAVTHGYRDLFAGFSGAGFGQSGDCNVNVNCSSIAQTPSDAVAMIIVDGTRSATGSLVNNACYNYTPNFLTAFHVLDTAPFDLNLGQNETNAVANWVFQFQYKSPTCTPSGDGLASHFVFGAQFRSAWFNTDFALLRLNARPVIPNTSFLGWDRTGAAPTSAATIHHPAGDVMKISVDDDGTPLTLSGWWNANTHWRAAFNSGTAQPGSSGAPLINGAFRVVGQLHGFLNTACPRPGNPGYNRNCFCGTNPNQRQADFGRFDLSWDGGGTVGTRLSQWLTDDPLVTQTNTTVMPRIAGPGQLCGNASYTLLNPPPAGIPVSWEVVPAGLVTPSSGTGTTANLTLLLSGNAVLRFNVGCGNAEPFTYPVRVGGYASGDHPVTGPSSASCGQQVFYNTVPLPHATSYQWVNIPPGATNVSGQGTRFLSFTVPSGIFSMNVGVMVASSCNQGGSPNIVFTNVSCFGGFSAYTVYPNPSADEVTVQVSENRPAGDEQANRARVQASSPSKQAKLGPAGRVRVEMLNRFQRVIAVGTMQDGRVTMPTKHLPIGIYFMRITKEGEPPVVKPLQIIR